VIPIIVLIVISIGLLGTSLLTARDFERGTAKMLVISPVRPIVLVLGRLLGGTLITIALVTPLVILGFLTHNIPACAEESNAPLWLTLLLSGPCGWILPVPTLSHGFALIALLLAVTLMTVGLGTLLGVAMRDTRLVTMLGLNGAVYLFFLGGGFTTVAFLPRWLQIASRFVPTSHAIEGLRQALFYPNLVGFANDMMVLSGSALLSIALASVMLTRALRRA
jgi:ABC-type multidrug transport system permease subunit